MTATFVQAFYRKEHRMRKLMIVAAMLAMVLVAAAPAMAQTTVAGDVDSSENTSFLSVDVDATQTQTADVTQYGGDAIASGGGSVASVENELFVDQTQVNGGFGFDGDLDNDGILDEFEFVLFTF